ncbi:MAG: type II toxin-antitoxin system RelE/ParE family toxin [Acutalibacteraceae bacterium]
MKIIFSKQAREDLREINQYISDVLQNPIAAKNVIQRILKSCNRLSQQPNMGVSLQAKIGRKSDYRCLFCENYIAFYLVDDETIRINRILDGRTEYMKIIFS